MSKKKPEQSTGYAIKRYLLPTSLLASRTTKTAVRARKRPVIPALTFEELSLKQERDVATGEVKSQTAANRSTILRGFLRSNGCHMEDVVGDEMRQTFSDSMEKFLDDMRSAGRSNRDVSNSKSALMSWRKRVVDDDTLRAIEGEQPTPFRVAVTSLIAGQSPTRIAKQCGVSIDMLTGWMRGKIPRSRNAMYILRLESYFGLERESLVRLAGFRYRQSVRLPVAQPVKNAYRETLGRLTKVEYFLQPHTESPLRTQWKDLLQYKTALVPELERTQRGRWRFSPCPIFTDTPRMWHSFLDGREIASAQIGWSRVASFLGWMALPVAAGGLGKPTAELQTLAWLAVPDVLGGYLNWTRTRANGKRTKGAKQFLAFVSSLVRPGLGYIAQHPELKATLPMHHQETDWSQICVKQFSYCQKFAAAIAREIEVWRDPFEPIQHIIDLPEPLEAVVDMVHRMRANRPVGAPMREAIWARDILIIKMLVSNPLRLRNLAHMQWTPDNLSELYQQADGAWRIRLSPGDFKNTSGAAGDQPYNSPIHASVWPDLERYVHKMRVRLMTSPTDLVFLSAPTGPKAKDSVHKPWGDLSKRVHVLTRNYLFRCPGIGTQAFRHLVATAILKASPSDFKTAALVLNDRMATVEKHYSGLRSGDGSVRMGELLGKSFKRM